MTYYEKHPFTPKQAAHAAAVAVDLVKQRFFLIEPKTGTFAADTEGHVLDPATFADAIDINNTVLNKYRSERSRAAEEILELEQKLGLQKPVVPENGSVFDYSRYTSGFDLCRIYPLTAFTKFLPETEEALAYEQYLSLMGPCDVNDVTPNQIEYYKKTANGFATQVWTELEGIEARDPNNHRCVVLMHSRINLQAYNNTIDFTQGRLDGMQDHPEVTAFLLHRFCQKERIVPHNYIVTSTAVKSHSRVQHSAEKRAVVDYNCEGGYTCPVYFATIL